MERQGVLRARARRMREEADQLEARAERLMAFGIDTHTDGAVILFTKRFKDPTMTYTYAAVRARGCWYTTGRDSRMDWTELVAFIEDPENVLWVKRPDSEFPQNKEDLYNALREVWDELGRPATGAVYNHRVKMALDLGLPYPPMVEASSLPPTGKWRGSWRVDEVYTAGKQPDMVVVGGKIFMCLLDHVAMLETKPGAGRRWWDRWVAVGPASASVAPKVGAQEHRVGDKVTVKRLGKKTNYEITEVYDDSGAVRLEKA